MDSGITEVNAIMAACVIYSSCLFREGVRGKAGAVGGHFGGTSWSTLTFIQHLTSRSIFSQINKDGKQRKKFIGYKNNICGVKQDAMKEQMFSKVEATRKLTLKSIC